METTKIQIAEIRFIPITEEDFPEVQEIYAQGIQTGNATFETTLPDWQKWDSSHLKQARIAVVFENRIIGWGALSRVSDRCVYEGVAEISVYIHTDFQGRGIGTLIMKQLIEESERAGIWSLMSGVFPENEVSIHIHLKEGFRIVGTREKIAKLHGVWRDTVLLQRRSTRVGID